LKNAKLEETSAPDFSFLNLKFSFFIRLLPEKRPDHAVNFHAIALGNSAGMATPTSALGHKKTSEADSLACSR
jgi:hypothetical protein